MMQEYYIDSLEYPEGSGDLSGLPVFDTALMLLNGQWRREDMYFVITTEAYPDTILALDNVWLIE